MRQALDIPGDEPAVGDSSTAEPGFPPSDSKPKRELVLPTAPPPQYRADLWTVGVNVANRMPAGMVGALARNLASVYSWLAPVRRHVVAQNLLPVLNNDPALANAMAGRMFRAFGQKLADLWRFEAGRSIEHLFHTLSGWDHLQRALEQGRGTLLVTVHLGNWEFGAPLLTQRGVPLHIITAAEPDPRLTEVRQAARARWGIQTIALGSGPFAAVEVVRRLEANGAVALLMDRPPTTDGTVTVKLFGRDFVASGSAYELARATGCAVLPVYLVRDRRGYVARILPEIRYDRSSLRDPKQRVMMTQTILSSFETAVRENPEQWYHFVPVWPGQPYSP